MLANVETNVPVKKTEYKSQMEPLGFELAGLQRECHARSIPVILVINGPSGSGKGRLVREVARSLDARGFNLHTVPSTA